MVYLSGVPGSLVHNYRVIIAGLWARASWKQAGHSTQSIDHLLDVARRLSSVSFIALMLIVQDVFPLSCSHAADVFKATWSLQRCAASRRELCSRCSMQNTLCSGCGSFSAWPHFAGSMRTLMT